MRYGHVTGVLMCARTICVLEGVTYIVSKNAYKQNVRLCDTHRQATRDRIFSRLASGITATYLSNYAKIIETSIPSHPKLKNTNLLDLSVEKIYIKLKNETFLNEKNAWINLYEWFKSYVTHYVVR